MNNAFLQFELDSASREIATFTKYECLERFKRLNFRKKRGMRNITKENARNSWKSSKLYGCLQYSLQLLLIQCMIH